MHYTSAKANAQEQLDKRRALRREMTPAETVLWKMLRGRGERRLRWRRQQGIGPYILDFYCAERRLCVELDGSSHGYKFDYDERRTAYLEAQGIRVVRFTNDQVLTCLDGVMTAIAQAAEECSESPRPCRGGAEALRESPRPCRGGDGGGVKLPLTTNE